MQLESAAYLWDVRAAGNGVATFTSVLTQESYVVDELRKSAVERQLEIVGEALNKLRKPPSGCLRFSRSSTGCFPSLSEVCRRRPVRDAVCDS